MLSMYGYILQEIERGKADLYGAWKARNRRGGQKEFLSLHQPLMDLV